MKSLDKKGISPLAATIFLIAFAIALGTIVMTLGRSYVETIEEDSVKEITEVCVAVPESDPLAALQIDYLTGKIDKESYLDKEKALIQE